MLSTTIVMTAGRKASNSGSGVKRRIPLWDLFGSTRQTSGQIPGVNENPLNGLGNGLRILLIGTHLRGQAGNRSVGEDLAAHLVKSGYRVALTSRKRSRYLRTIDMLSTAWRSRRDYDVAQVDVYSGNAFRWAEWATKILLTARKPVILTLHGGNLPEFAERNPRRVARLLSSAVAVTAPSQYLASAMRGFRSDIRVIPNSIDVDLYVYNERQSLLPSLVWVRAFHRIYDPTLAVRVLAQIAEKWAQAHLTMFGPDKDGSLEVARSEAARLGVLSRISFPGHINKSEIPARIAEGHVFLNTATIDNTPVSVIEAMASGLPVVSTKVGGIPYLLEDEKTGMLVPRGDSTAMAAAVMKLLENPSLAKSISRSARLRAETFRWENIRANWEELLHAAVQVPPRTI
jgi:glycosyltransferase involved in cell wall biosynthesis